MRFLVTMLIVLLPLCAQDPAQKKGGGGGGNFKNLQVLTPADMQAGAMRQYVAALGVAQSGGCNFCHAAAPADKSSDDNPKKLVARTMISMVKDINTKLTTANIKATVTCYTCHRGKTEPESAPAGGLPLP